MEVCMHWSPGTVVFCLVAGPSLGNPKECKTAVIRTVLQFKPGNNAQLYILGGSVEFECLILTVTAYDRYLAICNPLRYSTIMSLNLLLILSIVSWLLGFFVMSMTTVNVLTLEFCGSNIIDHFFCDLAPILLLSCSETSTVKLVEELLSIPALIFPLTLTGASYVCIIRAILRISSNVGRQKAFSTCGSHLTVVCIYYGTLIATYMLPPKGLSLEGSKAISLLYTAVTPMMNPIIYSLRNIEIKNAITFFSRNKLNINKFHYERT
ncbi:olfactory receptor 1S1-like [Gastrophryne carolinensis]